MNLTRMIVSLIIICIFMPLSTLAFRYVSEIKMDYSEINDEIALYQLREILLLNYDMYVTPEMLNFHYQDKDYRLSLVNRKLILQPGTQIFLSEIDDLYFDVKNDCIYVYYEKNDRKHEKILAKAGGIYLDRFSDCAVSDEHDHSPEE